MFLFAALIGDSMFFLSFNSSWSVRVWEECRRDWDAEVDMGLRGWNWQEMGESCLMRDFVVYNPYQLFGWSRAVFFSPWVICPPRGPHKVSKDPRENDGKLEGHSKKGKDKGRFMVLFNTAAVRPIVFLPPTSSRIHLQRRHASYRCARPLPATAGTVINEFC